MTARSFFDVFYEYSKMYDFLHTLCFGFFRDMEKFEYLWNDVLKELDYWRRLGYNETDGSQFTIVLYPSGDLRVKSDDTGSMGDVPGAMYCRISVRYQHPFTPKTYKYSVLVTRIKEEE